MTELEPMTVGELKAILSDLGWSQADLAHMSRRDIAKTKKMCRGLVPIDDAMAVWLRALHPLLLNPPPRPPKRSQMLAEQSNAADPMAGRTDPVSVS